MRGEVLGVSSEPAAEDVGRLLLEVGVVSWLERVLEVRFDDWGLTLRFGPVLLGLLVLVTVIRVLSRREGSRWKPQVLNLGLGGVASCTLLPDDDVTRIAHEAWVELATRKAAIPVQADDVLVEVYDSWYELFRALRQLARQVPARVLHRSADAKTLLDTLVLAMNLGLRPHLTRYQAAFRDWWGRCAADAELAGLTPQERQARYPGFVELKADMLSVNAGLIEMAAGLRRLAHDRQPAPWRVRLVRLVWPRYKIREGER